MLYYVQGEEISFQISFDKLVLDRRRSEILELLTKTNSLFKIIPTWNIIHWNITMKRSCQMSVHRERFNLISMDSVPDLRDQESF